MKLHENGIYYTQYGSIYNKYGNMMLDEDISILLDLESATLLKVGTQHTVETYFESMRSQYQSMGIGKFADSLTIISFHVKYEELGFAPDGYNLNIDEVCTILNWFNIHIEPKCMRDFLELPLDTIRTKIKKLQELGF